MACMNNGLSSSDDCKIRADEKADPPEGDAAGDAEGDLLGLQNETELFKKLQERHIFFPLLGALPSRRIRSQQLLNSTQPCDQRFRADILRNILIKYDLSFVAETSDSPSGFAGGCSWTAGRPAK